MGPAFVDAFGRQIEGHGDAYRVLDDIEHGRGRRVPLWMFGLLYRGAGSRFRERRRPTLPPPTLARAKARGHCW